MTLRERNKSEKKRRIIDASRALFASQGFDATTTRQIADGAHVGLATLFLYASDKRDLLFLACNDDLEELTERAFAGVDRGAPFVERITSFFQPFFALYSENRRLWQDVVRELTFFTAGQQSGRFQQIRQTTISYVEELVRDARESGEVVAHEPDRIVSEVIFFVFAAEIRRWLGAEETSIDAGASRLRLLLGVIYDGLKV